MRIAICDDERNYIEELTTLLEEYFSNYPQINASISTFPNGMELLEACQKESEYDIYFLDIIMPDLDGISLGRNLRNAGYRGTIIYLTSSPEYAIDSFRVRAYDYLLKPLKQNDLFSTMDTLIPTIMSRAERFTIIKTKEGRIKLNLSQIMYVQLSNRSLHYHLIDGKIIQGQYLRTSFNDALSDLAGEGSPFVICGAGVAANLTYLTRLEDNKAYFCDNKYLLHMGNRAFRVLQAAWVDYCINAEDFL